MGPNLRVPHLTLPPEVGSEDRRVIPQRQLGSRPLGPCWTWEDTI